MEIYKTKKYNYDCSLYTYHFINDDLSTMSFHQTLNRDLVFDVEGGIQESDSNEYSFVIKKSEFKEVYDLIENMLQSMKKRNDEWVKRIQAIGSSLEVMPEYRELFEKGYFSWKSDAPANEDNLGTQSKIYNYLDIIQHENEYELKFISNYKGSFYACVVEVNTSRSRYDSLRFPVWDFFKNLEKVCEEISMKELNRILDEKDKELTKKLEN